MADDLSLYMKPPAPDGPSWLQGFANSTIGSTGEFFGFQKPPDVQSWDIEHPVASTVGGLTGYMVPFVGWDAAVARAPKALEVLGKIGNMAERPIMTTALREAAKYAPLEAGRVAVAAGFGDMPTDDVAAGAATDLGLIGATGGLFRGLTEFGAARRKLTDLVPGASADMPPQLQMRAAEEYLASGTADESATSTIKNRLAELQRAVRLEDVPAGAKFVGDLEDATSGKDINRLFRPNPESDSIDTRKFIAGTGGFWDVKDKFGQVLHSAGAQLDNIWNTTGFGEMKSAIPYVQFPRVSMAKSDRGAGFIQSTIQRDMKSVGEGLWLGREQKDGLYVVAKKVFSKLETGAPSAGDKWVLFKTDAPGRFAAPEDMFNKTMIDKSKWMTEGLDGGVLKPTGARLFDFAQKMDKAFPLINYMGLKEPLSKGAELAQLAIKKSGLDKTVGGAAQTMGEFVNRYFVPNAYQFGSNPRANWIRGMAGSIYDEGKKLATTTMYGEAQLVSRNLYKSAIAGAKPGIGLKAFIEKFGEHDLLDFWRAQNSKMSIADATAAWEKGELTKPALELLKKLDEVDDQMISEIHMTQAAYGQDLFKPMKDHYMISRSWVGDYRVPIYNEHGKLVYMASGKGPRGAQEEAKKIVEGVDNHWSHGEAVPKDSAAEGPIQMAGYFDEMALNKQDYYKAAQVREALLKTGTPKFMEQRSGVGGYLGEKAPWTKDELEKSIFDHLQVQQKYLANTVVEQKFSGDLAKLMAEDPKMFAVLSDRLKDLQGKPGPLSQIQNAVVDKVLAPVLGPNSASKIVRVTNDLMMNFTLGAWQIGQPILNALTFAQTVLPELSFVLNAVPSRVARYYSVWPAMGADGIVKTTVHTLDPLKIMKQSFGEMAKPSDELFSHFQRAAVDGVVAPRMVEDYIGESAVKAGDLKTAFSSGKGFAGWLRASSEYLLAGSEKLSRGNAFIAGHILGRDFLGLSDDALYQFAKKFTQRTMYGYSVADRSRIFTTPAGSAFGLFKNWMTHFMGSMLEYTGEGVMRNNWSPLMWQLAGSATIGGVAATGPAYFLADKFSNMANNKSLMDNMYDLMGGTSRENLATGSLNANLSDAMFFGLPALLGTSLSQSASQPLSNPARDITYMMSLVHLDRAKALGKAIGLAVDQHAATGQNPFGDPTVRDAAARALLPKTIYRVLSAYEDKTIKSLGTQYPVMKDASLGERAMYMSGLNPLVLDRSYKVADELWDDKTKMESSVAGYGKAYFEAQQSQDYNGMQNIMLRTMRDGIDFSRVLKSVSSRTEKMSKDNIERNFDPANVWNKRQVLGN